MAHTVTISPRDATVSIEGTVEYALPPLDPTESGIITYEWFVDGVSKSTQPGFTYIAEGPIGVKNVKVVSTYKATEQDPIETLEDTTTLNVVNKFMVTYTELTPKTASIVAGSPLGITCTVTGQPEGSTIAYQWSVNDVVQSENTSVFNFTESVPGQYVVKCSTTTTAPDYDPETSEGIANITIEDAIIYEDALPYVHPLPQRNSAYIWVGWWVLYEIQDMTLAGKDWKTDDPDSKYYLHRYTLSKMLTDYPEVDVQESRNGYVLHRSAFDVGIFY